MTYNKPLPAVRNLLSLAKSIRFPATREQIIGAAGEQGLSVTMHSFLNLFPADERFRSRVDFMTRCEALEMFINQERSSPRETAQTNQE